jgi:acetolactate synthase-1/2/3 large subunit
MGYSLPAAIGVAFSENCLRVVAFTGDGSLHQNIQELGQMAFLKLPIVLIVLNNDGYLSIRASQMNYFDNRFIGTDDKSGLGLPDISAIARAYEIPVVEVETVAQLDDFLTSTISTNGPVLVNVKTPRNQAIVPSVSSKIDEQGVMSSRNLEDMTPLLDGDVLEEIMSDDWGFL